LAGTTDRQTRVARGRPSSSKRNAIHSAIVTVLGEIDLAIRTDLESCLQEAIASEVRTITLELSGVSFIDLAGLEPITNPPGMR
jgi:anti-anti-sigma regulatory factor